MTEFSNITDICNKFASSFESEIEQIRHKCSETWLHRRNYVKSADRPMTWEQIDQHDVSKVISNLSSKKSAGADLIRMNDLKSIIHKISPVMAHLVNLSVNKQIFPDKLKKAVIRPIHKKGDKQNYTNYRPIAILSSIDKIMEKCVVNKVHSYLKENNVLNNCQYGFQSGKSTTALLAKFTNDINESLNNKNFVIAVFFDFKKAFDTLEHETLLTAMEECGVGWPLNQWFRDYLARRTYTVKIGDKQSVPHHVTCGVPQGSCCGPMCYLMHVNSLCNVIKHCSSYMFADDLCMTLAGNTPHEMCRLVQQDVDDIIKWSHDNGISINAKKTKMIVIRSPYCKISTASIDVRTHTFDCFHNPTNCKCESIEIVPCVTYLGVKVDEFFSWSFHVDHVCNRLRILLGKFYHLRYKVPPKVLKCMYMSLVESVVSYALDSYGLTFKSYIDKIELLQIRFLKLLVNDKTKQKCKGDYYKLFKICNVLPAKLKHKLLLITNNHSRRELLTPLQHSKGTRASSAGRYFVPRISNYYGDRTLRKRLPYLMNSIPSATASFLGSDCLKRTTVTNKLQKILLSSF